MSEAAWLALLAALVGVIAALLGAWAGVTFSRLEGRRKATLGILESYVSPEFFAIRAQTSAIRRSWLSGDRSIVHPFVSSGVTASEPVGANGMAAHQNVSWLLHFYATLSIYVDSGLVDKKLLHKLFDPHYLWYREFFVEFCGEYQNQVDPSWPVPMWQIELPRLDTIFAELRTQS